MRVFQSGLVPVPGVPQQGICPNCHTGKSDSYSLCHSCHSAGSLAVPIVPIAMSEHGSLLHNYLSSYKRDSNSQVRERSTLKLAALLSLFIANHRSCIGDWDVVTTVPSQRGAAVEPIIRRVRSLESNYKRLLTSAVDLPRESNIDRFETTESVEGMRVLLIDDTFTSGSSLFSAAGRLRLGGASVAGPIVIGRHVRSSWAQSSSMLKWLASRTWDASRCCECSGEFQLPQGDLF